MGTRWRSVVADSNHTFDKASPAKTGLKRAGRKACVWRSAGSGDVIVNLSSLEPAGSREAPPQPDTAPNRPRTWAGLARRFIERRAGAVDYERRRHEWVRATLQALPAGWKLLDVGAGECRYRNACGHLDYTSQDFCQYDGSGDAPGLRSDAWNTGGIDIVSDITSIPEPDGKYDAVLCTEVLEHVPDPVAALREIARLARPGGMVIVTAPFASLTHMAPYHYVSGFNAYFFQYWLPALGLEITELAPNGNLLGFLAQEVRRVPSVAGKSKGIGYLSYACLGAAWLCLNRLARRDTDTAELLCLGYHVTATKGA